MSSSVFQRVGLQMKVLVPCVALGCWLSLLAASGWGLWQGSAWAEAAGQEGAPAAPAGPKNADFQKMFQEWQQQLAQLEELRLQYRSANPAEMAELRQKFEAGYEKLEADLPKLIAAADAAFEESPQTQGDLVDFLVEVAVDRAESGDFTQAKALAEKLAKKGVETPQVHYALAQSAFGLEDFATAQMYFKKLSDAGIEEEQLKYFQKAAEDYGADWPKEKAIRDAEAQADDLPRVMLKTSKGDIVLELFENEAPNTVANFVSLVEQGFYNGLTFHRVIPGFVAQGGCPKGDGTGDPGYRFADECNAPNARRHYRGSLSMANSGPNTNGSQFFITYMPTPHLNGKHTVFGRVVSGMDVVEKLQSRDPQDSEAPAPDKIISAQVLRKRPHPYAVKRLGS